MFYVRCAKIYLAILIKFEFEFVISSVSRCDRELNAHLTDASRQDTWYDTPLSHIPASILRKSISGRHRPVRVADGPMTARYRFT